MFAFIPVILLLFASAVYASHLLLVAFFEAEKRGALIILASLIAATAGFILVFFLSSRYDNFFIQKLYLLVSLIIGFLFYLTISGILFQFALIFRLPFSKLNLARILVVIALALFVIGVVSAFFFKVKTVEVKIDNLPDSWRNKKIVLISDLHLGNIHGLNFLEKVANKVDTLKPDYLMIAGDLFDGTNGGVSEIGPKLNLLQAKSKVIFIPGNHDKYLGLDKIETYLNKTDILELKDEAVNIDGLEVIGFDFLNKEWEDTRQIKNLNDYHGQARLLLNHVPTEIDKAKAMGISLQLSGHSHRGQMWPVSILTRMIYGRYHYGLTTEGNYNIYTTSGVGSWGPPLRTFNRPEIVQIILK